MNDLCPKCDGNVEEELYELEWGDMFMGNAEYIKCPYCGATLRVSIEWDFEIGVVEEE